MPVSLLERVALVTGAGRGVGRSIAMDLARHGAKVIINDLGGALDGQGDDISVAESVVREIEAAGGTAAANTGDVTSYRGRLQHGEASDRRVGAARHRRVERGHPARSGAAQPARGGLG